MATEFNIQPPRWEVVSKTESDEPVWLVQRTDSLGRTRRAIVSRTSIHAADTEQTAAFHNRARVRDDGLRFIGSVSRHPNLMTYTDQWAVLQDAEWPYRCDYYLMTDALPTLAQVCRDRAQKQPELIRLDSDPDVAALQLEQYQASLRLSEEDILRLGTQIYEALKICLENELTAVPVTPDNIYMDEDGNFLLGHLFGISDLRYNAFEKLGRVMYRLVENCDPDEDRNIPRHCGPELATFVHAALTGSLNDELVALLTGAPKPEAPEAEPEAVEEENTDSTAALWQETASRLVSVLSKIQTQKAEAVVQTLRSAYSHITPGPDCRVLVFARGKAAEEALAAGADYVGGPELAQKIQDEGWYDFDVVIATPDMMGIVGRLGALLDSLGLFPSIIGGTITTNAAAAVRKFKNSPTHVDPPVTPVTQTPKKQEVQLPKQPKRCVPLAVGCEHIVGLKKDGTLITAGEDGLDQCEVSGWKHIVSVDAGNFFTVGLKEDGTMVTAGGAFYDPNNFAEWNHLQAVAAGGNHLVALKEDGSVLAVGDNRQKQCNVAGWQQIRAIAAADYHTVGVMQDGTLVATGANRFGECDIFKWNRITAVAAGEYHTVGLKEDGTVIAIGNYVHGQCRTDDWNQITAIAAGSYHTLGLRADGTVVAVGDNDMGQCNVRNWKNIVAIAAKGAVTLGLRADGAVLCTEADYDTSDWNDIRLPGQEPAVPTESAKEELKKPAPTAIEALICRNAKMSVPLTVGAKHTVGLKNDGTVVAIGDNSRNQCNVSDWRDTIAVAAGGYHTVGLRSNGTVLAIGSNAIGQCNVSNWTNIAVIAAGDSHTLGLKADGTVVVTGNNADGRSNVSKLTSIVSIAAGSQHTVCLEEKGTVVAAGSNEAGQCNVAKWTSITAIAAGNHHTVGLRNDGTVVATGSNIYKQCKVSDWTGITAVAAGRRHTVGLKNDGTVVAVGDNNDGQCNVSTWLDKWTDIVAIAAGEAQTYGLKVDGTILCTGTVPTAVKSWNNLLLPGQKPVSEEAKKPPVRVEPVVIPRRKPDPVPGPGCRVLVFARSQAVDEAKAAGADYVGAEDLARKIQEEGWDAFDVVIAHPNTIGIVGKLAHPLCDLGLMPSPKLGTVTADVAAAVRKYKGIAEPVKEEPKKPVITPVSIPKPPKEPVPLSIAAQIRRNAMMKAVIAAGRNHSVALSADGTVKAVGSNQYGQCSANGWKGMTAVAAGGNHTVALRGNGRVLASGNNQHNQCSVVNWISISQIAAGEAHTVGLKADGTVMAIGSQDSGQCNVMGWRNVGAIAAGAKHTVALQLDGTVLATGSRASHQCDVGDWNQIVAIAAGDWHTVGLRADGTVVAVGNNISGQCRVQNWSGIIAIAAGTSHTIGLKKDGTVVSAGNCRTVDGWRNVIAIAAGGNHSLGLRADGTVLAAGMNQNKECAVQDWKDVCVPASKADSRTSDYTEIIRTKVKAASTIAASSDHAAFVMKDGHIHCVGKNQFFQCDTKDWKNMKAVAVGNSHTVGLMEDGTVKAAGKNITGQCKVSLWHNITQISACGDRTMGLRSNGTVAAAGIPTDSAEYKAISAWRDIVAVVAGYSYTFGLKADGTLVTAGSANAGQCDVADWKDIVAVSAGLSITVGLKADGTVVTAGKPPIKLGGTDVSGWREIDAVIADGYNVIGIRKDGTVICTGDTGMNPTKKAVSEWRQVVAIARGNLQIIGLNSSGKLMAASVGAKHPYDVSKLTNVRVCGEAKTANGDVFWHRASLI